LFELSRDGKSHGIAGPVRSSPTPTHHRRDWLPKAGISGTVPSTCTRARTS